MASVIWVWRTADQPLAAERDVHARQHCAAGVGHGAGDRTGLNLRMRRRGRKHAEHTEHYAKNQSHASSLSLSGNVAGIVNLLTRRYGRPSRGPIDSSNRAISRQSSAYTAAHARGVNTAFEAVYSRSRHGGARIHFTGSRASVFVTGGQEARDHAMFCETDFSESRSLLRQDRG